MSAAPATPQAHRASLEFALRGLFEMSWLLSASLCIASIGSAGFGHEREGAVS